MADSGVIASIDKKEIHMKMIQAGIGLLGLALLAGCETRVEERGEGGTYGNGTYERGYGGTYGNGTYERGPYETRRGWYDSQGYWHEDRHYRH